MSFTSPQTFVPVTRRLIISEDLNAIGGLFGGRLALWIDEASAVYAMEIMGTRHIATKKISELIFNRMAKLGDILEFSCRIKTIGRTSLTIECSTTSVPIANNDTVQTIAQCDVVMVAIDDQGRPTTHKMTKTENK